MKKEYVILALVLLVAAYFLFWKKDDTAAASSSTGSGSGAGASGSGSLPDLPIDAKESPASKQFSINVPKIKGTGKWFTNRQQAVNACRGSGGRFVEGAGVYAGMFGCL